MDADARFCVAFSRQLTIPVLSLFDLCNIVRPSQQQLSSCAFLFWRRSCSSAFDRAINTRVLCRIN